MLAADKLVLVGVALAFRLAVTFRIMWRNVSAFSDIYSATEESVLKSAKSFAKSAQHRLSNLQLTNNVGMCLVTQHIHNSCAK